MGKRNCEGKMEINRRKKERATINLLHQHQLHFAQHYNGRTEGREWNEKENIKVKTAQY